MSKSTVTTRAATMTTARKLDHRTGRVTTYFSTPDFVPIPEWPPRNTRERLAVARAYATAIADRRARSNWHWFFRLVAKAAADTLRLEATGLTRTPEGTYQFKETP